MNSAETSSPASASVHGQWSSKWAFVLAATGSAVGLGNIWRFPYVAGENGGGAFVCVYLLSVLLLGLPVMMAEIMLGRRGRRNPVDTMGNLGERYGRTRAWCGMGWMGLLAGTLILSFYSVVAGWLLHYLLLALGGGMGGMDAARAGAAFDALLATPGLLLLWHSLFMVLTVTVVALGVEKGLERMVKLLMPLLFAVLLVLAGYGLSTSGFGPAMEYLFRPDFSKLGPAGVLAAMGQAFFSLSIGMGAIMAYGSYLPRSVSLPAAAGWVVGADTLVALLAGVAIFPLVFSYGLEPGGGPGLIFQTLPLAFARMPLGSAFAVLFFGLLLIAAWTSSVSLLEPFAAWVVENTRLGRRQAAVAVGLAPWLLGIGCLLSLDSWKQTFFGESFFDLLDYLTSSLMLPLGGLLIVVFTGWFLARTVVAEELGAFPAPLYRAWLFLVRWVAPLGIVLLFLFGLGVFSEAE